MRPLKSSAEEEIQSSSKDSAGKLLQKIHSADEKDLDRMLGKLSWLENPDNEKELYEKMKKYPLYEILTIGMSREEQYNNIKKSLEKKGAKKRGTDAAQHTNSPHGISSHNSQSSPIIFNLEQENRGQCADNGIA